MNADKAGLRIQPGDLVRCRSLVDAGYTYGKVIAAGPKVFVVEWENGVRFRHSQTDTTIELRGA